MSNLYEPEIRTIDCPEPEWSACDVIKMALDLPEIAALNATEPSKKKLVSACVEMCGGLFNGFTCPYVSAAEQDRTFNYFAPTKNEIFSSSFKIMPSILIILVVFIFQKLF